MRLALALLCLSAAVPAAARPAECYLEVGGVLYISGICDFENIYGDGSFILNGPEGAFFAQVAVNGNGTAEGWWNGQAYAAGFGAYLGTLYRNEACWVNDYAAVCAW